MRDDLFVNWRLWNLREGEESSFNREVLAYIAKHYGVEIGLEELKLKKSHKIFGRFYLHANWLFAWPRMDGEIVANHGFCHALSGQFGILADGRVVSCCLDVSAEMVLGRIQEAPLREIFQSKHAKAMRDEFRRGELVEEFCRRCGYISRFAHQ